MTAACPAAEVSHEKRERLEKIIALQRDILARHVNQDVATVPQIATCSR
jgi:hypothetical protein